MTKRRRADHLLYEQGLCTSRTEAQRLIMAGKVRIGSDHVIQKPGQMLPAETQFTVTSPFQYVSRGALKLLAGIQAFAPVLTDRVALDVGASTGGFTDVLLRHGVRKVFAVDVGYGQLHQKLREDPRVICLERVHARELTREQISEPVDILVADVSFISLTCILPACADLLAAKATAMLLVKPQFEATREHVGRGGVVRDESVRQQCLQKVADFAVEVLHWRYLGFVPSPIKGPKGNQEYIAAFHKD